MAHFTRVASVLAILARITHRLSSRSGGSAGGSALCHVATETPAGVLLQYAEEIEGGQHRRCAQSTPDDPAAAADSLGLVRAKRSGEPLVASHRLAPAGTSRERLFTAL